MPITLLRLAVALLTFGLGVTTTTLWIAYRTPEVTALEAPRDMRTVRFAKWVDAPPPPPPPAPLLPVRAPILGGVLNGKAISLPQPAYPAIVGAARASGSVIVQVLVDENGDVISAKAISGHPLLQQAAVAAALRARFAPTRLSGQPVKISGVLAYNFVLP